MKGALCVIKRKKRGNERAVKETAKEEGRAGVSPAAAGDRRSRRAGEFPAYNIDVLLLLL